MNFFTWVECRKMFTLFIVQPLILHLDKAFIFHTNTDLIFQTYAMISFSSHFSFSYFLSCYFNRFYFSYYFLNRSLGCVKCLAFVVRDSWALWTLVPVFDVVFLSLSLSICDIDFIYCHLFKISSLKTQWCVLQVKEKPNWLLLWHFGIG